MARTDKSLRARLDFLEREAREHPRRHAARLLGAAMLGYAYPVLLLLGTFAVSAVLVSLVPSVWSATDDLRVTILLFVAIVGALVLTVCVLGSLYVTVPAPNLYEIGPNDCRPLREMIEEVRKALGSPVVHHVHIDTRLNAAISQRSRFGFWGPLENHLIVGIPLLMAMTPEQYRAVIAHEFGHLRGRHGTFSAWIYRVQGTWETIAGPLRKGKLRRMIVGWFIGWYGPYFATTTLALRRMHEYDADLRAADCAGKETSGEMLAALSWSEYRMGKLFWPALFRSAKNEPLPPGDVMGRIAEFLGSDAPAEAARRWLKHEMQSRTPITSEHPCLVDRVRGIGCGEMLQEGMQPPGPAEKGSALGLLGEQQGKLLTMANASWKAIVIERWRQEHSEAKEMREKMAKNPPTGEGAATAEQLWDRLTLDAEFGPADEALATTRKFLERFPDHAPANFMMGRLLLDLDDDEGAIYLERAIKGESRFTGSSLQMLLAYYREAGRDAEADPIRERYARFEREIDEGRNERFKVRRRDRFAPHDLTDEQMREIRRVLYRYPQVTSAYIAKKAVKYFSDQSSYVIAVRRKSKPLDDRRYADKLLVGGLMSEMPVVCAAAIYSKMPMRLRARMRKVCPVAIYGA